MVSIRERYPFVVGRMSVISTENVQYLEAMLTAMTTEIFQLYIINKLIQFVGQLALYKLWMVMQNHQLCMRPSIV